VPPTSIALNVRDWTYRVTTTTAAAAASQPTIFIYSAQKSNTRSRFFPVFSLLAH
jgi:hypothetical protein